VNVHAFWAVAWDTQAKATSRAVVKEDMATNENNFLLVGSRALAGTHSHGIRCSLSFPTNSFFGPSQGHVDLLLIHWPSCLVGEGGSNCPNATSSEPFCQVNSPSFDAKACRLNTWKALVTIWQSGGARAVGVSNYNASHLQEIKDAGLPLPAVNQIPYNVYTSSKQDETVAWCKANNVLVNGYSPFGVPDHRKYTPPHSVTMLVDPVVMAVAAAHSTSAAVVTLAWQHALGIVFNPRSMNAAHILENLGQVGTAPWWELKLSAQEMQQMSSRPQL
jgi:diketogulonate reductase-like aldo/keto reductase